MPVYPPDHYRTLLQGHPLWLDFMKQLEALFSGPRLDKLKALHANAENVKSVRELWLQGELFFCDQEHIQLNKAPIIGSCKADVSYLHAGGNGNPEVVAEIKWIFNDSESPLGYWRGPLDPEITKHNSVRKDLERLHVSDNYPKDQTLHLMVVVISSKVGDMTLNQENARAVFLNDPHPGDAGVNATELKGIGPRNHLEGNIHVRVWRVL